MISSYEEAIEKYGFYIATPIGTSMMPLLRERIDTVKLIAPNNIKKHDVVLYMRNDKTLVLHRIIRINKDEFTMCGDNQCILEKHVKRSQIIAVMEGFYRGEEYFPITNKKYQKYVRKIIFKRPFKYIKYLIKKILTKR
ncbi:MAG: S24/S26 family peptidase [Bacilli bacterium]|nr:S24/S26 family peptidase [Bacilli bacterium]